MYVSAIARNGKPTGVVHKVKSWGIVRGGRLVWYTCCGAELEQWVVSTNTGFTGRPARLCRRRECWPNVCGGGRNDGRRTVVEADDSGAKGSVEGGAAR